MSRRIRLIWDFYGEPSEGTAKHHVIHLEEFMEREKLPYFGQGIETDGPFHCIAYLTVSEDDVRVLRDTLRPNRAFVEKTTEE